MPDTNLSNASMEDMLSVYRRVVSEVRILLESGQHFILPDDKQKMTWFAEAPSYPITHLCPRPEYGIGLWIFCALVDFRALGSRGITFRDFLLATLDSVRDLSLIPFLELCYARVLGTRFLYQDLSMRKIMCTKTAFRVAVLAYQNDKKMPAMRKFDSPDTFDLILLGCKASFAIDAGRRLSDWVSNSKGSILLDKMSPAAKILYNNIDADQRQCESWSVRYGLDWIAFIVSCLASPRPDTYYQGFRPLAASINILADRAMDYSTRDPHYATFFTIQDDGEVLRSAVSNLTATLLRYEGFPADMKEQIKNVQNICHRPMFDLKETLQELPFTVRRKRGRPKGSRNAHSFRGDGNESESEKDPPKKKGKGNTDAKAYAGCRTSPLSRGDEELPTTHPDGSSDPVNKHPAPMPILFCTDTGVTVSNPVPANEPDWIERDSQMPAEEGSEFALSQGKADPRDLGVDIQKGTKKDEDPEDATLSSQETPSESDSQSADSTYLCPDDSHDDGSEDDDTYYD